MDRYQEFEESAPEMKEKKKFYDAIGWRNLPTDVTMNAFLENVMKEQEMIVKPSVTFFRDTLRRIEETDPAVSFSIYEDIFSDRSEKTKDVGKDTMPRLLPWEVVDLLERLIVVQKENKGVQGDALSSYAFSKLATDLTNENLSDVAGDYKKLKLLSNELVQQQMLKSFETQFLQRLTVIKNEVFSETAGINIDKLRCSLEQLDVLIYLLQEFPSDEPRHLSYSSQELIKLYLSLTSTRRELLNDYAIENGKPESFNWNVQEDTELLVNKMISLLRSTSRNPSQDEVNTFLDAYQKYLIQEMACDTRKNAIRFAAEFLKVKEYMTTENDIDRFQEKVKQELYQFAQSIFSDLHRFDTIEFSYSSFNVTSVETAFVRSYLADCHQEIQYVMHTPFNLIRKVFISKYYIGHSILGDSSKERLNQLAREIEQQCNYLEEKYPTIPKLDVNDSYSLECYLKHYNEHALPVFCETDLISFLDSTLNDIETHSSYPVSLTLITKQLEMLCRSIVAYEVENAIAKSVQKYKSMKSMRNV